MSSYLDIPKYLAPLSETKAEDDFSVLIDRETIRNLAKNICTALRHPVTVLDINRLGSVPSYELRIDSDIEYFSLRGSCRLLRHCAGLNRCHKCDEFHATILKKYIDNTQISIDEIVKIAPSFFYDGYKSNPPQILKNFTRPCLVYHCPILGYRELLLPIYYENIVIGILFLGQSIIKSPKDKKIRNNIANDFFSKEENNPNKIFADFISEYSSISDFDFGKPGEIRDVIIKADEYTEPIDKYLRYRKLNDRELKRQTNMTFDNEEEYNQFICNACIELDEMEERLEKCVKEKREKYFNVLITEAVQEYFSNQTLHDENIKLNNKYTQEQKKMQWAWEGFRKTANIIQKKLNLKDMLLFGDGVWTKIEETKTKKLYPLPHKDDKRFEWKYDFSIVKNQQPTAYDFVCSLESNEILEGLNFNFDKTGTILLAYPDMAILLLAEKINEHIESYNEMAKVVGKGFSRIRSSVALCAANFMKEHHVLTLRMNRHESAHISTRLSDNMERYFANKGQTFLTIGKDKQALVVDDMKNTVRLISHMASNIGLIIGSINKDTIKNKEQKLNMYDLLFKWQVMFRDQLRDRNLDLIIARNSDNSVPYYLDKQNEDAPGYVLTHPDLFELLIYNLVDNAVKYAHRGSIICLRWQRLKEEPRNCILTVSSFGPQMDEGNDIYELYARGDTAHLHAVEGDGIGLYVVKRAEELLKLTVRHTCTSVVPSYNLPLIEWYLKEDFNDKKQKEIQYQLKNYLIEPHDYRKNDIVNDHMYTRISRRDLSKEYLNRRINRGTWLTTFTIMVPNVLNY